MSRKNFGAAIATLESKVNGTSAPAPVVAAPVAAPPAPAGATAVDPAQAALMAEIAALKAQNDALKATLKASPAGRLTFKVSEKGALSVYGLGRFPTTLYPDQWERILDKADDVRAYIAAHRGEFKPKE